MMRYMKRAAQIVVLTVVLVFGTLLVLNSGVTVEEAKADNHWTGTHHWLNVVQPCDDPAYHWYDFYY